jgi:hypothetical protein
MLHALGESLSRLYGVVKFLDEWYNLYNNASATNQFSKWFISKIQAQEDSVANAIYHQPYA